MGAGPEAFYCQQCEVVAWAGEHDCSPCEVCGEHVDGEYHYLAGLELCEKCYWDRYDGPCDGEEWSGGFASNH
jgi:hypothetical protein